MLFLFKPLVFTYDINTLPASEIFLLHSIKKYIFALRKFFFIILCRSWTAKRVFFLSYRTLDTNFILTQLITYAFCINITCLTARGNAVCFDPTGGRLYPNLER